MSNKRTMIISSKLNFGLLPWFMDMDSGFFLIGKCDSTKAFVLQETDFAIDTKVDQTGWLSRKNRPIAAVKNYFITVISLFRKFKMKGRVSSPVSCET